MKRKLLLIAIAVVTAFVCAFGFIACTDDEPDLSSVNGTYYYYVVTIDEEGNIESANKAPLIDYTFKDGKVTTSGITNDYTLNGKDIVVTGMTFKYVSDGIYLTTITLNELGEVSYCLIREDVTPSFDVYGK